MQSQSETVLTKSKHHAFFLGPVESYKHELKHGKQIEKKKKEIEIEEKNPVTRHPHRISIVSYYYPSKEGVRGQMYLACT